MRKSCQNNNTTATISSLTFDSSSTTRLRFSVMCPDQVGGVNTAQLLLMKPEGQQDRCELYLGSVMTVVACSQLRNKHPTFAK